MNILKHLIVVIALLITAQISMAQCCGNGICEPGENATNCPYDCATSSFNCTNTIGSFFSSPTYPVSSSTAQANGWCYTLTPPYPTQICFEYIVPNIGDTASVSFSINACGGSTVNQGNFPPGGGCNNAGYSSSTISSVGTYDANCNLISSAISTGGAGCYTPGDIITVCLDINPATTCTQIEICPVINCGGTNCTTTSVPPGCPPFSLNDSTYITPCDSTSGYAVVTPACGDHFTYLWDDPLAQTDSFATGLLPGTYNVIVTNTAFSCDTTITVTVPNTSSTTDATITPVNSVCENSSPFNLTAVDVGGNWSGTGITNSTNGIFDPSTAGQGSHTITYAIGGPCGDTSTTNIEVLPIVTTQTNSTICQGDSILLGGIMQNSTGLYYDTLQSSNLCDSIIETTLTINPASFIQINDTICQGDSILLGGIMQNSSGTYYDTLQSNNLCDSIIETTLAVSSLPIVTTNNDTIICPGLPVIISANGASTYFWNNGMGVGQSHTVSPLSNTTYLVTGTNIGNCSDTSSINIDVEPITQANAGFNQTLCNDITTFSLGGNTPILIGEIGTWATFSGAIIDDINQANSTGSNLTIGTNVFVWTITNSICPPSSDSVTITFEDCEPSVLIIPNIFTPNGDGANDIFTISGINLESLQVDVYNRWGQHIYSWNNVSGSWDGRTAAGVEVPDGTYFFLLSAVGTDGVEHFKKGTVSLIR